ncbi:MerR family transcriptional regulator [Micromonospora sp. IBHARD004]|uniref:MerR family transcriptional regulator n=1 Tax=Micromonospora sp. IBHARD004 TaxID=3457764 RepID=UPI0040590182
MNLLRSGAVAAAAGVHPQTLRYYERRGLLAAPDRSLGGHRRYPAEVVTVLRVIKAAQRLGFTLGGESTGSTGAAG